MDAFFAAVEMLDRPELRGKAIIVGGLPEERGVVATASYEARQFGVHSAMSSHQAYRLCPRAIFVKPRGTRYAEISRQVFQIFEDFTPITEKVSIDEAFLDVTGSFGLFGSPEAIGHEIKRRILEELGLVASVGVAPNKFLAKLASDLEKPDGFVVIRAGEAKVLLAGLPIGKLWGVGKVTRGKLERLGIRRIGDLRAIPPQDLERHLGSQARTLLDLARGIDDRPVVVDAEAKSIGAETTFVRDIAGRRQLHEHLDRLVERVARRLRDKGRRARTIHLKARYADFTTVTRAHTLPSPTALTSVIRDTARELLDRKLGRADRPLRLLGVSASNLKRADEGQLELFPDGREEKAERVDHLIDDLQDKYGEQKIHRGKGSRDRTA